MRIAIDAFRLMDEPGTSGATYVALLAPALAATSEVESVTLLVPRAPATAFRYPELRNNGKITFVWPPTPAYPARRFRQTVKWIQWTVPRLMRSVEAEWYIAPYHQAPIALNRGVRVLTVIHDVCGLSPSSGYPWHKKGPYRHLFNFVTALWRSDAYVYVSKYTKSQFERVFPLARWRPSRVVLNRVDWPASTEGEASLALAGLGIEPASYFLALASPGPRKGLDLVLASFRSYLKSGGDASLVLVAPEGFLENLHHIIADGGLGDRVRTVAWVSVPQRDALYSGALALLFPSRCEGFGYPIVEALAWGCPTIAWRHSPASEILEDALPLLDKLSPGDIASQLHHFARTAGAARTALRDALREKARHLRRRDPGQEFLRLLTSRE